MFPELRARIKNAFSGFGSTPIALDLKAGPGISFDAVNVGWYARNGFPGLYSVLSGGLPSWSGEAVSVESALNHSVVWACNRIISESIGMIPAVMLQEKDNSKQVARNKPMYSALKNAPNDEITAAGFSEQLTSHCLLQGNGYAQIMRRSGTGVAMELHTILPQCVYPDREKAGQKRLVYVIKDGNSPDKSYTVVKGQPHDILHIRGLGWDGIRGYSVISMGRNSIGSALSSERNGGRFWAGGGRVPYILELDKAWKTAEDEEKFRFDWERLYGEPHRAVMAPPNVKYKQIGLTAHDAQMLETRLFNIHEICRWFLVSPHLVGDLSKATFSNIEQLAMEFVKMTLATWITRWEQELWRCVLTDEEKAQGYLWRHNVNVLLRGDFASRMAGYSTMLQNGIVSINEVRDLEDWNPVEGGDDHHIQLNMQSLPGDQVMTAQGAALVRLGKRDDMVFLETKAHSAEMQDLYTGLNARLDGVEAALEKRPPPPAPTINVHPPNVTVQASKQPDVKVEVNLQQATKSRTIERDAHGLITGIASIEDKPIVNVKQ